MGKGRENWKVREGKIQTGNGKIKRGDTLTREKWEVRKGKTQTGKGK